MTTIVLDCHPALMPACLESPRVALFSRVRNDMYTHTLLESSSTSMFVRGSKSTWCFRLETPGHLD